MAQKNSDLFSVFSTKLDPAMAEVLDEVCNTLQVDVYHLLQWFCYTLIRASSTMHELDPRIQKLLTMLECDCAWQTAFNLADRSQLDVSQVVLILQQKGKKGVGAVLVDKPFFDEARQTECVDTILERVCSVTMPGVYRRLRRMGARMKCESLMDLLLTMLERQELLNADDDLAAEGPQLGDIADNGHRYAYGKKTKAKQHRTVDSLAEDKRTLFDNLEPEAGGKEADDEPR